MNVKSLAIRWTWVVNSDGVRGSNAAPPLGIYVTRLDAGSGSQAKRLILLK
jgi:hypothetical protein